jgi:mono/diheme cytochrome c family protein
MAMSKKNSIIVAVGVAILLIIILTIFHKEPRGALLFKSNDCITCHTIKGKGGSVGPNLTYVGQRRSRSYIIEQIISPKLHNPDTAMPSFARLPEKDINDLADYLSNLK